MRKNVASQLVAAQLVAVADGSDVTTGTTTVYVTIDGGTQASGGTATHEGNGCWSFVPSQANTNGDHIAYTFVNSAAISQTINVYPVSFDYTDAVRMGLTALPNAAAAAAGGLPVSTAGSLDLDAKLAATNEVTAARMGALTDWIDGGRLDLLLDAIKAVTDLLPDSGALTSLATAAALATVDTEVGALQADLDNGTDGLGALLTAIQAVRTGTIAELTVDPGATPTLENALMLLYMAVRNKRDTTSSSEEIHNDAGSVILTATLSDNGTVLTKGKFA